MLGYKETQVNKQVKIWQNVRERITEKQESPAPFVTISREYGCGGYEVASKLADTLNEKKPDEKIWSAYDKELVEKIIGDMGLSRTLVETLANSARNALTNLIQTTFSTFPPQVAVYRKLAEIMRILAMNGNVILVGRAGNLITRGMKGGYHVRLIAPLEWKINRVATTFNIPANEAKTRILEKEKGRETFIREFIKFDVTDPLNYDLVINYAHHSAEQAVSIIMEGMKACGLIHL